MNENASAKINRYIDEHSREIIETLTDFARIPSISQSELATFGAPFGKECKKMLERASEVFGEHGFSAKISREGHYAVANFPSGCNSGDDSKSCVKKTIGVFAHSDVVPTGEGWIYTDDPFSPVLVNGCLIGRGVNDNKSGLTAALYIPEILKAAGINLKSDYSVFIGSSEETGMQDLEQYLKENGENLPDVSLVPDGCFPVCAGEKSICRFKATCKNAFQDIVEFKGGMAYNIVLDKIDVKMKYGNALYADCVKLAEKGDVSVESDGDCITVRASGIAKHAATPQGGLNAAYVFANLFKDCPSLCANDRKILSDIALFTNDFNGEKLGLAHEDFLGKLTFVNGICALENSGQAVISVDIRHGCTLKSEQLVQKILSIFESKGWDVDITELSAGYAYSRDDEVIKLLENVFNRCVSEQTNAESDAKSYYLAGGTYSRMLKNAYTVGTTAYYVPSDSPELPDGHGGAHQCDENLSIAQFLEAVKVTALMVYELDKRLNP